MILQRMNRNGLAIMILLSLILMGMDGAPRENDEQRQLEERLVQLAARVEKLKEEQDLLLFQRSIAGSDSKYLLLDVSAGTGTFRYRNRVLRTFGFTLSSSKPHQFQKGLHVLAGKTDGSSEKRSLVVQDSFIIQGKKYSGKKSGEKKLPGIIVNRKDLAAIYYSVEKGTMLYVIR